ncbi:MAG: hypothetical protein ACRYFU_03115 [Janthinobacterium lividum]
MHPVSGVRRHLIVALGLIAFLALATKPSHAQFGGIVLDPTQSAHAGIQIVNEGKSLANQATRIAQGSEENMTLAQQLSTDVQLAATAVKNYMQGVQTYTTISNNLKHFSSKSIWRTLENQLTLASFANRFGETAGLEQALGGNPSTAGSVWNTLNTALSATSSSFWSGQIVGQSNRLATLTRMEAMDGVSTHCLAAVGTYNQGRQAGVTAITSLQDDEGDDSDDTNSEVEQLNLVNGQNAQSMNETQAQGQLHACLAEQAAIGNMAQRNAAAEDLNTWAFVQQQQSMNNAMPAGSSNTWTTYLP